MTREVRPNGGLAGCTEESGMIGLAVLGITLAILSCLAWHFFSPWKMSASKLTSEQQLRLEIETARVRHSWAKEELKRAGSSPALERYAQVESHVEWRALKKKQPRL